MENKNGSGIFLGVVSVATLIVAIIGATFAYFSATVTGNGNVDVTAYEFNASLSISPVYPTSAAKIIPMDPTGTVTGYNTPEGTNNTNLLYAINEATNKCVDTAGHQVCTVYSATFKNNGSEDITLEGVLKTTKNDKSATLENGTPFANLKIVELTGALGTDNNPNTFALGSTLDVPTAVGGTKELEDVEVEAGETVTKYFVVYLNEADEDNNPEMGASYTGQLVYTSSTGAQELTGTFNLGGQ